MFFSFWGAIKIVLFKPEKWVPRALSSLQGPVHRCVAKNAKVLLLGPNAGPHVDTLPEQPEEEEERRRHVLEQQSCLPRTPSRVPIVTSDRSPQGRTLSGPAKGSNARMTGYKLNVQLPRDI